MLTRINDSTNAGEARRQAAVVGEEAQLSESERGALAIVVTEITTNVLKHAGTGIVMIDSVTQNGHRGVRVLGLDHGHGIGDLAAALRDGFSSSGTAGNGLGAIRRLSSEFDIYSMPERGTAVLSEIWPRERRVHDGVFPLQVGVVCAPIRGEDVCGDGWSIRKAGDSALLMVVDGLGHGSGAAEAARTAETVFRRSKTASISEILQETHDALKATRGAALALVSVESESERLSFAGVGNIGASIVTPDSSRGMVSHHGIVGHHLGKIQEFRFPWSAQSVLVMHSDGLKTNWSLESYPGIWHKHPALIAGVLYRDFTRDRDDVTVLVAKTAAGALQP
ncbi:MAG TPA: ATP-binding SpoIIE family protein phosphatase [Candidatus Acidoferrum sp.]|nr:ATP-binding SpoIIE family protein phosphatase [Candidatus Acidoferrum sp.]